MIKNLKVLALTLALGLNAYAGITPTANSILPDQTGLSGLFLSTDGFNVSWQAGDGPGTVTSVSLTLPSIFNVTGSPVTTAGTLTAAFNTQSPNVVFAGPASGGAAAPTFRALVASDFPSLNYADQQLSNLTGTIAIPDGTSVNPANAGQVNLGTASKYYNNLVTLSEQVGSIFGTTTSTAVVLPNSQILRSDTGTINQVNWSGTWSSPNSSGNGIGINKQMRLCTNCSNSGTDYISFGAPVSFTGPLLFTLPGTNGSSGQFLQTDGTGVTSWQTVGSSGANQDLSNLTNPTAINQDLLPGTTLANSLGSSAKRWLTGVISSISTSSVAGIGSGDLDISTSGGSSVININPGNITDFNNKPTRNMSQVGMAGGGFDVLLKPAATPVGSYSLLFPPDQGGANQILKNDGLGNLSWANDTDTGITQITGDVTAGPGSGSQAATVVKIQGRNVSSSAPSANQYLKWNSVSTTWEPTTAPSGVSGAVQFSDGSGNFSSDAANFFWDDTNDRLGLGTNAPAYTFDSTGQARNLGHMAIGNNAVVDADSQLPFTVSSNLIINETSTINNKDEVDALTVSLLYNPATDSPATGVTGIDMNVEVDASNAQHLAFMNAMNSVVATFGSGLIDTQISSLIAANNQGSGDITDNFGIYLNNGNIGGGNITNNYGIYIDNIQGTNTWALYQNDATAKNYFAGNVGIKTSTPGSALDVKGEVRLSGATSGYVGLSSTATPTSYSLVFPAAQGSAGQTLQNDGAGNLSWATSGPPTGDANTMAFFNGSGDLSDQVGFTWNGSSMVIPGDMSATKTATDAGASAATVSASSNTTVNGSNTTIGINGVASATVQTGAENDKTLGGMNFAVTRGDGTDQGILDSITGSNVLMFHNSDVAGVTNQVFGYSTVLISQQGTVTDLYDYFSQRAPAGGVVTNHYGVYISDDSTTPVKNWLSGSTQFGGGSFTVPTSTVEVNGALGFLDSGFQVNFVAPTLAASTTYTWPATDGGAGDVLSTDGGGALSWIPQSGSAPTGDPNTVAFFDGGGALADQVDFTWDGSTIQIPGNIMPEATGTRSIGSSSVEYLANWGRAFKGITNVLVQAVSGTATIQGTTAVTLSNGTNNVSFTGTSFNPSVNNAISLGGAANNIFSLMRARNFGAGDGTSTLLQMDGTAAQTFPGGQSISASLRNSSNSGTHTGIFSSNSSTANTVATGNLYIGTGNKTAGNANSGDMVLRVGTPFGTGVRGTIALQDGSEGTAHYLWSSTDTTGKGAWVGSLKDGSNVLSVDFINRLLVDSSAVNAINYEARQMFDSSGNASEDFTARNLYTSSVQPSIDWENHLDFDNGGQNSLEWDARQFYANDGSTVVLDYSNPAGINLNSTVIQSPAGGTVTVPSAAGTLNVVDARVTTSSLVVAVVIQNDATAKIANVVPHAGNFDINMQAAPTLNTSVRYVIFESPN